MKLTRLAPAAAAFAAAAITLSACGGGSATGESGGGNEGGDQVSGELVGFGASSQKAAIQSELNLDAATAAQIFAGKITKWNDKAIADLNPDADLPDTKITA
ncbi:phosphate ABC transporter substrate-binding protein PstS, partial [Brevibacterium paucivorans]